MPRFWVKREEEKRLREIIKEQDAEGRRTVMGELGPYVPSTPSDLPISFWIISWLYTIKPQKSLQRFAVVLESGLGKKMTSRDSQ